MNNKEIIIDGVDVSECSYYANGKCTNNHMIQSNCKNVVVCYYKEYKRKEQECEKAKQNAQDTYELYQALMESFNILQEEREKAKNYNLEYGQLLIKATNKNNKLKQTLTEIKEIAEKHAPRCNDSANCNYTCEACHLSDLKQILQKINECEINNEC